MAIRKLSVLEELLEACKSLLYLHETPEDFTDHEARCIVDDVTSAIARAERAIKKGW